jgi:NodT family efflux transporter outer membrane factor (OMF) lipoprotein
VGPDYVRPESPQVTDWQAPLERGLESLPPEQAALARFWTELDDPLLTQLVERALAGNWDVAAAEARLRQTRALRKIAIGRFFPTVTGSGGTQRVGASDNTGGAGAAGGAFGGSRGGNVELYSLGLDASWEIDVFGRLRRNLEAANAERDAAQEDLRDVQVSLIAELALAYVDTRALQERLRIAEATLASQSETYDITDWRAQAGLTTVLDVERARTSVATTEATIPTLRTALDADVNGIAILLGEAPGAVSELLAPKQPIPVTPREVAVGVPAGALAQRPDVRRAERVLAAETARVGVATADAYPSLNALGSIGLEALSPGGLFKSGATLASLAATATQTIFAGGQVIGSIEAQEAVRDQALASYRTTVLAALNEVENALIAYAREQDRRDSLAEAAGAAERALALAQDQYGSGLIDFQVVLDSQRALFVLQDQLAESEGLVTSNLVRLYKAIGGGWAPEPTS